MNLAENIKDKVSWFFWATVALVIIIGARVLGYEVGKETRGG